MRKILITGASGFLGKHTVEAFKKNNPDDSITTVDSSDYDLTQQQAVTSMFNEIQPEYVVHLAARSGTNRTEPADYYYKNLQLITLTLHEAWRSGVKNILIPMGGCSYPATAKSPIGEDQMWEGFPQIQSAGYSMAKKMALVQSWAYREQYGFKSTVVIPGNMYGEYDNFSLEDSHVVPAMIRKLHHAKQNNLPEVTFWGTGKPQRDFVYVGDVAKTLPYFLFDYNESDPVNISSGKWFTIGSTAAVISDLIGYKGKLKWDTNKPDGQMVKIFDVSKLKSLGLECDAPFGPMLYKVIKWYEENYPKGVRL